MTTGDFNKCVSDFKEKAMALGKELVTDGTIPVTVKVLIPSETGIYSSDQVLLFDLYWCEDGHEGLSNFYTSQLFVGPHEGYLAGRAICAINVPHEEYPLVKDLKDLILEGMEYSKCKSLRFYAFEVAEYSDGCLRGTMCFYECYRQDQRINRIPVEACIIIFK